MLRRRQPGFTLMELMVTLAVAAVLATIAVPNLQSFFRNNRLTSSANDLLRAIQISRSEAIKRQVRVVVCASDDPLAADPACSNGAFDGWIVFEDENNNWQHDSTEEIIEQHPLVHESLTVLTDKEGIVSFGRSGFAIPAEGTNEPTQTVIFHDDRGIKPIGNRASARAVLIELTGRARVANNYADICTALSQFSQSCSS